MKTSLRLVLGDQLFPLEHLPDPRDTAIFMAEDVSLCTRFKHHKKKLILFLAAMRNYADELRDAGFRVAYHALDESGDGSYEDKLSEAFRELDVGKLSHFEIEDGFMEARISDWAKADGIEREVEPSPMFLCTRERFGAYLSRSKLPRMADFYRAERKRLELLVDSDGSPRGGRWSFDSENREKLPPDIDPPELPRLGAQPHVEDVAELVDSRFPDHPGSADSFTWPVTRGGALKWLEDFVDQRLVSFGPYEDAISRRSRAVFHSALSSSLNLGLITPGEVIDRVSGTNAENRVPINSLEGFVRQIIGWREFVRGIYHNFDDVQSQSNFWGHERRLKDSWYTADTGMPPLDHAIRNARDVGWDHHIVRLMVVGNLMTLCEIQPQEAHRWFMEMYVDSLDWVMGPNVYGMALFSDGGIFATKPYICGSNYILKMSDYKRGDWCDALDGLYWRFIDRHRDYFSDNPRLAMMPRTLDRMKPARRKTIAAAAERFIEDHTSL